MKCGGFVLLIKEFAYQPHSGKIINIIRMQHVTGVDKRLLHQITCFPANGK